MKSKFATTLVLGISAACLQAQAVPGLISYQGRIVDGSGDGLGTGTPINRKILFRLFDAGTGGTRLWSEEQTVTISNGDFSVILGQGVNASYNGSPENPKPSLLTVFGGTDRYLEIVVDNGDGALNATDTPITPRQRLISTAYAIRAATADSVASGTDLSLRDNSNGLGWYGAGRTFGSVAVDGPVLYGAGGGALGSVNGATQNTALRWNNAGNVGIGGIAASSTYKLDVSGSIHGSSDLFIDGRIGVDTTSPMARIGIRSDIGTLPAMAFEFSGGGYRHFLQTRHHNSSTLGNAIDFYLNSSNTAGGSTAPGAGNVHGMTIDGAGVGIGLTAPTEKLDVSGNIKLSGDLKLAGQVQGGIRLPFSNSVADVDYGGGAAQNYISFGHQGFSEDFIGYRSNTFYFRDSPGGGDSTAPGIDVGGGGTFGGNLTVNGTSGRNYFKDSEKNDGAGLRVGAAWGYYGVYAETGAGAIGGLDGLSLQGDSVFVNKDGNTGIGTKTPLAKLDVRGSILADQKHVPVGEEKLRMIRGTVDSAGDEVHGKGFTSALSSTETGVYTVTFESAYPASEGTPSVSATICNTTNEGNDYFQVFSVTNTSFKIAVKSSNASGINRGFSFIVAGPR